MHHHKWKDIINFGCKITNEHPTNHREQTPNKKSNWLSDNSDAAGHTPNQLILLNTANQPNSVQYEKHVMQNTRKHLSDDARHRKNLEAVLGSRKTPEVINKDNSLKSEQWKKNDLQTHSWCTMHWIPPNQKTKAQYWIKSALQGISKQVPNTTLHVDLIPTLYMFEVSGEDSGYIIFRRNICEDMARLM